MSIAARGVFIGLVICAFIFLILTLWFISVARRARRYVKERCGH